MPQDLRIAIRLDADGKGFRGEMRLGAKALAQRFIPARAGNTFVDVVIEQECAVHPRSRGEH